MIDETTGDLKSLKYQNGRVCASLSGRYFEDF